MARNEEKQLARLNRFYLQKEKEEYLKKNPPRPKLDTLTSAAAIQKWLPSIKRDLDFNIKQSMVPSYPASKVQQFSERIDSLRREYKAFLVRLRKFDPNLRETPWTDRPYSGQKSQAAKFGSNGSSMVTPDVVSNDVPSSKKPKCVFDLLSTPILDNDSNLKNMYGFVDSPPVYYSVCENQQNEPLVFNQQGSDRSEKEAVGQFPDSRRIKGCNVGQFPDSRRIKSCNVDQFPDSRRIKSCNVACSTLGNKQQHPEFSVSKNRNVEKNKTSESSGSYVNEHTERDFHKKCNDLDTPSASSTSCHQPKCSETAVQHSLYLPYSDSEDSSDS